MSSSRLRLGCQLVTYGDVELTIRYSRLVEDAGFDFITLPDHLFHPMDERFLPQPAWDVHALLGAIAATTCRVVLMPGVTDTVRRHPAVTAHFVATLDHLSKGRAALGIGAGEYFTFAPLCDVKWDKPLTRLRESIKIIRALWSSTPEKMASFDGEIFKLKNAYLGLKPIQQQNPRIYVGGYGPKTRELVGELGDGWLPWLETPETYRKSLSEIRRHAERYGRKVQDIEPGAIIFSNVSRDSQEAKSSLVPRATVSMAMRKSLLENLGLEELARETIDIRISSFTREEMTRIYSTADRIPRKSVEKVIIAGTPDEAIGQIENYAKAGVRFLSLIIPVKTFEETIHAYQTKIIPYFQQT